MSYTVHLSTVKSSSINFQSGNKFHLTLKQVAISKSLNSYIFLKSGIQVQGKPAS